MALAFTAALLIQRRCNHAVALHAVEEAYGWVQHPFILNKTANATRQLWREVSSTRHVIAARQTMGPPPWSMRICACLETQLSVDLRD